MPEPASKLMALPSESIWIPGRGELRLDGIAAARAVQEYDSSLVLGYRKDDDEWVVFKKNGPDGEPFPVFGLGRELPHPDDIKRRLYNADIKRHGSAILEKVLRNNDARQAESRRKADEATDFAAEGFEWAMRQMGSAPNAKVFIPSDIPKGGPE